MARAGAVGCRALRDHWGGTRERDHPKRDRPGAFEEAGSAALHLAPAKCGMPQQVGHADVLIEIGPVDAFAPADQTPLLAFLRRAVPQARIPFQRCRDSTSVYELDEQGVFGDEHLLCPANPHCSR